MHVLGLRRSPSTRVPKPWRAGRLPRLTYARTTERHRKARGLFPQRPCPLWTRRLSIGGTPDSAPLPGRRLAWHTWSAGREVDEAARCTPPRYSPAAGPFTRRPRALGVVRVLPQALPTHSDAGSGRCRAARPDVTVVDELGSSFRP
ncbi:hypothetical protein P7K49_023351 [Saguinus oedipus]|uniref:Uncharacterized protein n=1 Tax=Saguinus oedipus TaxID=9490 RepID=A0ABQ9UM80_SAGOE|nr:hypothetical protein P7K49_023351 [Saguinus oedipus]